MKDAQRAKELKIVESEMVRDMKVQLKYVSVLLNLFLNCKILTFLFIFFSIIIIYRKAMNDQKEMKLLLDMYKGVSKDQRDKVQFMATEKKLRSEIDDLRNQLKKMQVSGENIKFSLANICKKKNNKINSRKVNVKNEKN